GVAFTDLAPSDVGTSALAPFDTAVLHVAGYGMSGTTDTLTGPSKQALVDFVGSGHKLIIWDSETAAQDYSWLPFPFTTSNPGQQGANGTLAVVEDTTLASNNPNSPYS